MTVVIISMAAMVVVVAIALFANRWDKKQPPEDPDLSPAKKRSTVATTSAIAATRAKKERR